MLLTKRFTWEDGSRNEGWYLNPRGCQVTRLRDALKSLCLQHRLISPEAGFGDDALWRCHHVDVSPVNTLEKSDDIVINDESDQLNLVKDDKSESNGNQMTYLSEIVEKEVIKRDATTEVDFLNFQSEILDRRDGSWKNLAIYCSICLQKLEEVSIRCRKQGCWKHFHEDCVPSELNQKFVCNAHVCAVKDCKNGKEPLSDVCSLCTRGFCKEHAEEGLIGSRKWCEMCERYEL